MRVVKVSRSTPMTSNYLPFPKQGEAYRSKRHDKTPKRLKEAKAAKFSGTAPAHRTLRLIIYEISGLCCFLVISREERSVVRSQILQR